MGFVELARTRNVANSRRCSGCRQPSTPELLEENGAIGRNANSRREQVGPRRLIEGECPAGKTHIAPADAGEAIPVDAGPCGRKTRKTEIHLSKARSRGREHRIGPLVRIPE